RNYGQRRAARRARALRHAGAGTAWRGCVRRGYPAGNRAADLSRRRNRRGIRDARAARGEGARPVHPVRGAAGPGWPGAQDLFADAGRRARVGPLDVDARANDARLASAGVTVTKRAVPRVARWLLAIAARRADRASILIDLEDEASSRLERFGVTDTRRWS